MDLRSALRALAEALPPGTAVPVPRELLLELLDGAAPPLEAGTIPTADLTVAEVAQRFDRHSSTVRGWLAQKRLPGAYLFMGREWRIPASALAQFEAAEREGRGTAVAAVTGSRHPVDISDWRRRVAR